MTTIVVVLWLSCVRLLGTSWTTACQVPLSSTISQSLLKLKSIELLMLSNHLILCCPLLFLPSIFPSIRVFSNELAFGSLHHVAKVLKFQLQQHSFQLIFRWIHDNSTQYTRKENPFAKCKWSYLHMKGNIIRNRQKISSLKIKQKCEFHPSPWFPDPSLKRATWWAQQLWLEGMERTVLKQAWADCTLACSATQSCPTLGDCMDWTPPGSPAHGIILARILEWFAISSTRGSSRPRDQTPVSCGSCNAGRFFTTEPPGNPKMWIILENL